MSPRAPGWQKRSGWHEIAKRAAAGKDDLPIVPSEWELLLRGLELREEDAVRLAAGTDAEGARLRRFVKAEAKRRFVPEDVLRAMKLDGEVERRMAWEAPWGPKRETRSHLWAIRGTGVRG